MKMQLPVSQFRTALLGAVASAAAVVAIAAVVATPARAAVYAEYTFNDGTANDSSGFGRNGVIVDPQGAVTYTGGAIDLTSNNGFSSNQDFQNDVNAQGAYVDLPNGLISGASAAGANLDLSFEFWFTEQVHRDWSRIFDFGTSEGGENMSNGGAAANYIMSTTGSGNGQGANDHFIVETHNGPNAVQSPNDGGMPPMLTQTPLPVGEKYHLAISLTQAGTSGGMGDNGTSTVYLNGVNLGSAPIADGLFIDLMSNDNNWLGRSQFPDQLFDGSYDQVTIHDNALSEQDVIASYNAGPVGVPFPTLDVNQATGEVSLRNSTTGPINLTSYSILSADGALDIGSWNSIPGWTRSSQTATNASESGPAQVIAANGSLSLGELWYKTPSRDLSFSFTTTTDSGSGEITYNGDAISRSDLNGDGSINTDDWTIFLANNATPLNEALVVGAYRKGDLDEDFDNDRQDFLIFKGDFIAANGAEAFAALTTVPEPSALLLCGVAGAFGLLRRRRA